MLWPGSKGDASWPLLVMSFKPFKPFAPFTQAAPVTPFKPAPAPCATSIRVTRRSSAQMVKSRRSVSSSAVPRTSRRGMRSLASYVSLPMVGIKSTIVGSSHDEIVMRT